MRAVDADVIIRLLTGDDPAKQDACRALFRQVEAGTLTLATPTTTIADAVYVLASPRLYAVPRLQIARLLTALVRLPHFHVESRKQVLRALAMYGERAIDFGDAMIAANMEREDIDVVYSYDRDFDSIPSLQRIEPTAA